MKVKHFWDRVKKLIKSKNIKQEILAKECRIPFSTLKGWIYKDYWPAVHYVARIAHYLEVSIDYLIYGKETDITLQLKSIQKDIKELEKGIKEINKEINKEKKNVNKNLK